MKKKKIIRTEKLSEFNFHFKTFSVFIFSRIYFIKENIKLIKMSLFRMKIIKKKGMHFYFKKKKKAL